MKQIDYKCKIRIIFVLFFFFLFTIFMYQFFGQQLIKSMYEAKSIGFLNKIIVGQKFHPLEYYIRIANELFWKLVFSFSINFLLMTLYVLFFEKYNILKNFDNPICDLVTIIAISIFSFYFCFKTGQRGFFAFDQSIFFDGGYRIFCGQIPYKDFIFPYGLATMLIQSIFFKLFGVNYFGYIMHAACINFFATILSILVIRMLFPSRKIISYVAGLLTAVWFYPPFGTPWAEQTSFFFSLVAITLLLYSLFSANADSITNKVILMLAGVFVWFSFLSKQNASAFMMPLYILLVVIRYMPDLKKIFCSLFKLFAGFCIGLIFFLMLILLFQVKFDIFLQNFIIMPLKIGRYRLFKWGIGNLFIKSVIGSSRMFWFNLIILFLLLVLVFFIIFYVRFFRKKEDYKKILLSYALCTYLFFFQNIFIYTTSNQSENGIGFIGLIFAVIIALVLFLFYKLLSLTKSSKVIFHTLSYLFFLFFFVFNSITLFLFIRGIDVSLKRVVHETIANSKFEEIFVEDKFKPLRWAKPTKIANVEIEKEQIVGLFKYLKSKNRNFFIFPDFTIFYGLMGTRSAQPILWFHKGLTYFDENIYILDSLIVQDLKKNNVQIVIIEEVSFLGTANRLNDFPLLQSYIYKNFINVGKIGIFNIYEKVTDS